MKIRNDQLHALQEAESQRAKTRKSADGFDELLGQELAANTAQGGPGTAISSPQAGLTGPFSIQNPALLEMQAVLAPGAMQSTGLGVVQEASQEMESMFSTLENYANQLALDEKADMRGAYSMLENVSSKISELRSRYPNMEKEQPGLSALVDELDVLALTETYKFNRGDYQ